MTQHFEPDLQFEADPAAAPPTAPVGPGHQLIRASAGAGKTYRLTSRYLALLADGAPPDRILATTFTRKAAGEILGRVLGRLAEAVRDETARRDLARDIKSEGALSTLDAAHCRAMLRRLVQAMHRMSISTIDGFFNRIASSFRFELDLPLDPQLVDESHPLSRQLRLEAIEAMLADEDIDVLLALLRRLHHDSMARSVTMAIDTIVTGLYDVYREAPDREQWCAIDVPRGFMDAEQLAEAIEALRAMEPHLPRTKAGGLRKNFLSAWRNSISTLMQGDWESFLSLTLVGKFIAGEEKYDSEPLGGAWQDVYAPLVAHACAGVIAQLARQSEATHDLLERFDAHYSRLRREHRALLFSDLTYKLARYLPGQGEDVMMEVYYRLDAQVGHLLLDEFQDTSLEQWRVLSPFADEVLAHGDGERSFFCVGDTKQAIYGWRGGCVELFDELEQTLSEYPNALQSLAKSWRSSQVVLDAVNQVFRDIASCPTLADDAEAAARWQQGFEAHAAAKTKPGYVELVTSPADLSAPDAQPLGDEQDDDDADVLASPASAHEAFVAERVRRIVEQSPGRSVGVLVSTNKMVNRMIYELRKLDVQASGEGGNPVTDCPAVAAVLSAFVLADHPGHTAAAFHVVNTPLGAVVGLHAVQRSAMHAAAMRIRRSLLDQGYAGVVADWVRALAPSCDLRSLTRLMQLVDLAERFAPLATLRPIQFVAFVEATRVEEPTPAPVRVMTVHASKGLEFDVVVLPELDRKLADTWPVLVHREQPTAPITAVYPGRSKKAFREQIPAMQLAYESQRARQRQEDLCKLYVAMTRARHALHLIVRPRVPKKDGLPRSLGLCFAGMLRERLSQVEQEDYVGGQTLYQHGDPQWCERLAKDERAPASADGAAAPQRATLALAKTSGAARRAWLTVSPSSLEAAGRLRGRDLLDLEAHEARQRGTLMHAWFELIGFIDETGVPDAAALRERARQVMPEAGEAWLERQITTFDRLVRQPTVRAVLERQGAAELWREKPFAVREGDRLMRGTLDRVAIHRAQGRASGAMLIDFKTDRVEAGSAALAAAVDRYRPQVQAYRRAVARLLNLEPAQVQGRLVFLSVAEVVAV